MALCPLLTLASVCSAELENLRREQEAASASSSILESESDESRNPLDTSSDDSHSSIAPSTPPPCNEVTKNEESGHSSIRDSSGPDVIIDYVGPRKPSPPPKSNFPASAFATVITQSHPSTQHILSVPPQRVPQTSPDHLVSPNSQLPVNPFSFPFNLSPWPFHNFSYGNTMPIGVTPYDSTTVPHQPTIPRICQTVLPPNTQNPILAAAPQCIVSESSFPNNSNVNSISNLTSNVLSGLGDPLTNRPLTPYVVAPPQQASNVAPFISSSNQLYTIPKPIAVSPQNGSSTTHAATGAPIPALSHMDGPRRVVKVLNPAIVAKSGTRQQRPSSPGEIPIVRPIARRLVKQSPPNGPQHQISSPPLPGAGTHSPTDSASLKHLTDALVQSMLGQMENKNISPSFETPPPDGTPDPVLAVPPKVTPTQVGPTVRKRFTQEETDYLNQEFAKRPKMGMAAKREIAQSMSVDYSRVHNWMQNKKRITRKKVAPMEDQNSRSTKNLVVHSAPIRPIPNPIIPTARLIPTAMIPVAPVPTPVTSIPHLVPALPRTPEPTINTETASVEKTGEEDKVDQNKEEEVRRVIVNDDQFICLVVTFCKNMDDPFAVLESDMERMKAKTCMREEDIRRWFINYQRDRLKRLS
ncbi:hypothetical protein QR680_002706 [Steinernema hermaphroditum]|uniref:Homeobox domain-containing protein n=1 Tax=Steinernema hermaphroditum TaxID=289476 RepID=A0AA39H5U8_9BILA|nr:hypothetical protein QR680_002706 [Steinernema hermaphroditum]